MQEKLIIIIICCFNIGYIFLAAMAGIAITAIILIASLGEKDVLIKYRVGTVFIIVCFRCIASILCLILFEFTKENNTYIIGLNMYIETVLILVISSSYSLWIVGRIAFCKDKFELKMLSNLFNTFWNNKKCCKKY